MGKLAINGGGKLLSEGYMEWPIVTEKEKKAVMDVLESRIFWGAYAPNAKALQKEWADYVGTEYCLCTGSGTSALHIAVAGAGIGPGDEVITSALTFVASSHAIMQQNAIPVFVDIESVTYNIDPKKIREKITKNTKAIIPVHLHGTPCDMDEIMEIAKEYGLIVIEDACQAHGASYKKRKTGSVGDMAAFSLNGSKNLSGGEGGLFNTSNEEFFRKARTVRDLGEVIEEGVERDYNAFEIGWMYRYTELNAAFTRVRLESLDEENALRIKNAEYLTEKLKMIKGVIPPYIPEDRESVFHLYRIRFDPSQLGLNISPKEFRAKVQMALRAEGFQANRWQNRPVPMQTLFQDKKGYGNGCPWACPFGNAKGIFYKAEDYTETKKVVDDSIVLHSYIYPPNGIGLMDCFAAGIKKLWDNLDEMLAIKLDPASIYTRD